MQILVWLCIEVNKQVQDLNVNPIYLEINSTDSPKDVETGSVSERKGFVQHVTTDLDNLFLNNVLH